MTHCGLSRQFAHDNGNAPAGRPVADVSFCLAKVDQGHRRHGGN